MNAESAREALSQLSLPQADSIEPLVPIEGGWSFSTFRVGADRVARFPRSEAVARRLEKEMRLLPALSERVSYRVPQASAVGRYRGLPFVLSEWIPGRPLAGADVTSGVAPSPEHAGTRRARVARVLAELHGFPSRQAAEILAVPFDVEAWRERYLALRDEVARRVEPLLEPAVRDRLAVGYARFLADELQSFRHPTLVHCDLGVSHLLTDAGGFVTGMLDFESASLGDPAIDFVGLQVAFGHDVVRDVVARYGGAPDSGFAARLRFYCWMGSVHAILYGLEEGIDAIVADGIVGLRERLEG
jgi:aminoglycoside phosphotransferase (APT) family kinase protein